MSRTQQKDFEQPGCIHGNMDLFKYAYQLYPLLPSSLLVECLQLAIAARKIDMRASPYDVSAFAECEHALEVETLEGRRQYAIEQEALYRRATPIRMALLSAYNRVLESGDSHNDTDSSNSNEEASGHQSTHAEHFDDETLMLLNREKHSILT